MTSAIRATGLVKSFGSLQAVQGLSLQVAPGEIYGLVGSDGAGKTTTLRLLVGALQTDEGEAVICDYNIWNQGEEARARVGYLSQRFSLYEDLSVLENIRFFAELRGLKRNDWLPRCLEILDFVGLAEFKNRRAGQLSGGMKQKLGLASALVSRPRLLLLDEPTTGVDPLTRQDFWQLIIALTAETVGNTQASSPEDERTAVLLTTPYMDEASRCHRVGFMRHGRLIAEGSPSSLRRRLQDRVLEVRGAADISMRERITRLAGVEDLRMFGDRLHLRIRPGTADEIIDALEAAFPAKKGFQIKARSVPATLEDVFLDLAGDPPDDETGVKLEGHA
jgi:ABC-2 type transport system ATP-binding protein